MAENEDTLTRCLLTACETLRANEYFTPTDGKPRIPVVEDVSGDIFQAIQQSEIRGMLVAVGLDAFGDVGSGGCVTGSISVIARVQEIVGQNRSASGVLDNAARVAEKVAMTLANTACCKGSDGAKMTGGSWKLTAIEPAQALGTDGAPIPQGRAYSVRLSATNFTLTDFNRLTHAPKAGAP
jgi:hypothetical protein